MTWVGLLACQLVVQTASRMASLKDSPMVRRKEIGKVGARALQTLLVTLSRVLARKKGQPKQHWLVNCWVLSTETRLGLAWVQQ